MRLHSIHLVIKMNFYKFSQGTIIHNSFNKDIYILLDSRGHGNEDSGEEIFRTKKCIYKKCNFEGNEEELDIHIKQGILNIY